MLEINGVQDPVVFYDGRYSTVVSLQSVEARIVHGAAVKVPRHVKVEGQELPVYKSCAKVVARWTAVSDGFIMNGSMPFFPHARPGAGRGCRCEDCRPDSRTREITV